MDLTLLIYPVLFALGAALGGATNWFVDRYCWTPRYRSPWRAWPKEFLDRLNAAVPVSSKRRRRNGKPHKTAEPFEKRWFDFIPIFGFPALRRIGTRLESLPEKERLPGLENRRFWVRPFFVEFFSALGVCWLFWWEVRMQMLLPEGLVREPWETVVSRFGVHVVFLALLLAASLIDIDDMIIPDILTIAGTVLALFLAAFLPQTMLPTTEIQNRIVPAPPIPGQNLPPQPEFRQIVLPEAVPLNLCSPNTTQSLWKGNPEQRKAKGDPDVGRYWGAMTALWAFWCFAMLHRVWYFRLPFRKAAAIFCRYLRRSKSTKWFVAAAVFLPATLFPWVTCHPAHVASEHHVALLSALVGMATGMGIVWGTRLVGSAVLGREAMGFGDVTLMGMIGAFTGWQACLMIFFLAPIAGLLLWGLNAAVGRGREFPYGPFLCLATAALIVFWGRIWTETAPFFELGWILGVVMLVCLVMLGVLLGLWRRIRERIFAG